jgi:pyridoxal phosphate enzyme (YggS family)
VTDSFDPNLIATNLAAVRARLERAAATTGRPPDAVRLIAVSKTFSIDAIGAAISAGQRDFGENRVQEAVPKIEALAAEPVRWHLIGHLQSNKARKAARPFDVIHSVDSVELLQRLDAAAREVRRRPKLLIQVDLAHEATKHGARLDLIQPIFEAAGSLTNAEVVGLMVLPPYFDDPEEARPYFRRLRNLRDELGSRGIPASRLRELSMGMSHDFEVAIAEGATMVRVGTAIFGRREPAKD